MYIIAELVYNDKKKSEVVMDWIDIVVETLAIAAALFMIWMLMVWPETPKRAQTAPFKNRNLAHRGLYSKDQSIPENSLPAFRAAVEHGYGAELDVQLTRDGQVVVFHDDSMKRACGVDGQICDFTKAQLDEIALFDTQEHIPLFTEVLEIFEGKQPLIVELKSVRDNPALCSATLDILLQYKGAYCVESFDPHIVRWFYKKARFIMRGQLNEPYSGWRKYHSAWKSMLMGTMATNFLTKPHFIAYGLPKRPFVVKLVKRLGAFMVCWTARDENEHEALAEFYDCIIFEHYLPEPENKQD